VRRLLPEHDIAAGEQATSLEAFNGLEAQQHRLALPQVVRGAE
jgi:hypothetical protein